MSTKPACLVVDDETDLSELIVMTLERMGVSADSADNLDDAKYMLKKRDYGLCLTDMRLPDGNGLDLVRHINQHYAGLPVAVITAFGSADNAVSALKAGAFDYLTKPISLQQLRPLVESALKLSQNEPIKRNVTLIGQSALIKQINSTIEKLARNQAPVLIQGDTGTGKALVAKLIHDNSARQDKAFVIAHCNAIAENLIEEVLFGNQTKDGLFQQANGGTLLIDEVADLPLATQIKVLRVIQEKKVWRVGSTNEEPIDVRIISSSQRNLTQMMDQGRLRQDLYYRLNVVELNMPTLREIAEDIPLFIQHFLERQCKSSGCALLPLDSAARKLLLEYSFPGNVKELENILERAVALCENGIIKPEDLALPKNVKSHEMPIDANGLALPDFLENIEKTAIINALEKTGHNKTAAAKLLGVSFRTLRYRLSKLGLSKDNDE
ncbi:MAG: sigma-54-dependent transcriptional regulator [Methylophilaceae bacterium]|uniref:sigma-54-dependent transcriptional regulator n=1 Tax=Methylovorus sp. MM2 TaxID=1848038 RepID=UPI0007E12E1F|nr:sigma-54 dependent transcriptional regulator [Methylovorus sp. MM2]OAM51761.1 sigma-54-dependent Fis family transcriptional regulator [Methylovorus sp. MM2]